MPANKNAMIRYLVLDRLFQDKYGYTIDELIEKVNDYLWDYDNSSVSKNTILGDIEFMEGTAGWRIELDRRRDGHRVLMRYKDPAYSIMNNPLTREQARQLGQTIHTLSGIKGLPNFRWLEPMLATLKEKFGIDGTPEGTVMLAQCENLTGLEWYGTLFDAIVQKRIVEIDYHRFGKATKNRTIVPYQLRQYNNRWFIVGYEEANRPRFRYVVVPLDRIEQVRVSSVRAEGDIPTAEEIREYYKHIVGVSLLPEGKVVDVVLKVETPDAWYMETKPIHESQRVVETPSPDGTPPKQGESCETPSPDGTPPKQGESYKVFKLRVIPNEELVQALMTYAGSVEVIEPQSLRDEIVRRAKKILEKNSEKK